MSELKHFNIFYSWQSDLPKKANSHFIKDCLEKAIKELNREGSVSVIPRLDKDTEGRTGSPNIADTIFDKIDACQIFVADVTIINKSILSAIIKKRLTPNPNVLIELGYAVNRLGWDRVICLNNEVFSKVEDMPFDIKLNRISNYSFNGSFNKDLSRKNLIAVFKVAIKGIIDNYQQILSKQQEKSIHQHDIKIFHGLDEILNDTTFLDLLQSIANSQHLIDSDYKSLDRFRDYLKAERNQFLVPEIANKAKELIVALNEMSTALAKNFNSRYEEYFDEEENQMTSYTSYGLPDNERYFKTYEEYEANRDKRIDENCRAIFKSIETYKQFRAILKQYLFI